MTTRNQRRGRLAAKVRPTGNIVVGPGTRKPVTRPQLQDWCAPRQTATRSTARRRGAYVRRPVEGARGAARRVARVLRRAPDAGDRGRPAQGRRRRPGLEGHLEEDGGRRLRGRRVAEGVG